MPVVTSCVITAEPVKGRQSLSLRPNQALTILYCFRYTWFCNGAYKDRKAPKYRKATKIPESTYKYQKAWKINIYSIMWYVGNGIKGDPGKFMANLLNERKRKKCVCMCVCVLSLTTLSTIFQSYHYNGVWMSLYWVFISNLNFYFSSHFQKFKGSNIAEQFLIQY